MPHEDTLVDRLRCRAELGRPARRPDVSFEGMFSGKLKSYQLRSAWPYLAFMLVM